MPFHARNHQWKTWFSKPNHHQRWVMMWWRHIMWFCYCIVFDCIILWWWMFYCIVWWWMFYCIVWWWMFYCIVWWCGGGNCAFSDDWWFIIGFCFCMNATCLGMRHSRIYSVGIRWIKLRPKDKHLSSAFSSSYYSLPPTQSSPSSPTSTSRQNSLSSAPLTSPPAISHLSSLPSTRLPVDGKSKHKCS